MNPGLGPNRRRAMAAAALGIAAACGAFVALETIPTFRGAAYGAVVQGLWRLGCEAPPELADPASGGDSLWNIALSLVPLILAGLGALAMPRRGGRRAGSRRDPDDRRVMKALKQSGFRKIRPLRTGDGAKAAGGHAVLYTARRRRFGRRRFAVKVLNESIGDTREFKKKLELEWTILRLLSTNGAMRRCAPARTVRVVDYSDRHDPAFLQLEYVEGPNLREVLRRRGSLPESEALAVARGIARVMAVAHEECIWHTDLSPENVLLENGDPRCVVVIDFGVARAERIERTPGGSFGKPRYEAPEHRDGRFDHRADIYSLGVMLIEMLTGEAPGEEAIRSDRIRTRTQGLSSGLRRLVEGMLEASPERRHPATMAEVADRLDGDRRGPVG